MKLFKDWFTENDGVSYDPIRMLAVVGVIEFLALAAHTAITTHTFDLQGFGVGLGAVLAAAGAAVGIKAGTEK